MSDRDSAFVPNPVLGGLMGLGPLAVAARSLSEGAILGLGTAFSTFALGMILPPLRKRLPERFRAPTSLALSAFLALLYSLVVEAYFPATAEGLWIYLPLIAVNCLCLHAIRLGAAASERGQEKKRRLFSTLLCEALGYFIVASAFGAFREFCGLGTLTLLDFGPDGLGTSRIVFTEEPPLRLLVAPAGGFLVLGLMTAMYRGTLRLRGRRIP